MDVIVNTLRRDSRRMDSYSEMISSIKIRNAHIRKVLFYFINSFFRVQDTFNEFVIGHNTFKKLLTSHVNELNGYVHDVSGNISSFVHKLYELSELSINDYVNIGINQSTIVDQITKLVGVSTPLAVNNDEVLPFYKSSILKL